MSTSTTSSRALARADVDSQSPEATWTEEDELGLLRAVAEIAAEPAEAFDPSVSPFARIRRNLPGRPFMRTEILAKVKELRRRYEEHCFRIRMDSPGGGAHDGEVENGELFEICRSVWGIVKGDSTTTTTTTTKKRKAKRKHRKKKNKKVHINKLLNDAKMQPDKEMHPQKHSLAVISSLGSKYHLECHQRKLSPQNGSCSGSFSSDFFPENSGKLTENIDLMTLRESSHLLQAALNDVDQEDHELINEPNQCQELKDQSHGYIGAEVMFDWVVTQSFPSSIEDLPTHGPEATPCAYGADGPMLLTESSCRLAENRPRVAYESCTEHKGQALDSAFSLHNGLRCKSVGNSSSLGMNCEHVRHEYPKFQIPEEPQPQLSLDADMPQCRPVVGFIDFCRLSFDRSFSSML